PCGDDSRMTYVGCVERARTHLRPGASAHSRRTRRLRLFALRREAEHDVEPRRQPTAARLLEGGAVDDDLVARRGVGNPSEDAVPLVARLALDVALGREQLLAPLLNLEVDVPGTAGVGDRFDGPEVVLAARTS